jgi:hypothetical protein
VHPESEIVQAAQEHIRGNRARVEHLQEMFRRRFDELAPANEVERYGFSL